MGAICFKMKSVSIVNNRERSKVDLAIIKALKKKKEHQKAVLLPKRRLSIDNSIEGKYLSANVNEFDKILMKFPIIKESFKKIRSVFEVYDENNSGKLEQAQCTRALTELGSNVEDYLLEEIFNEADSASNQSLDFSEFLVCMAIGYVLGSFNDTTSETSTSRIGALTSAKDVETVHKAFGPAFDIICSSYLLFDKDCDGVISQKEVFDLMNGGNHNMKQKKSFVTLSRWTELDFDDDGEITFKEFLAAFVLWIGLDAQGKDIIDDEESDGESIAGSPVVLYDDDDATAITNNSPTSTSSNIITVIGVHRKSSDSSIMKII